MIIGLIYKRKEQIETIVIQDLLMEFEEVIIQDMLQME